MSPGPPPSGIDVEPLLRRHYGFEPTGIRPGQRGYMLGRYFEDIEGHIERVLSPEADDAAKAESLGYFRSARAWLAQPVRSLV